MASSKKATKVQMREQKKKQREQKQTVKQQTKAAGKLRKVMQHYDANSHKVDRDYIVEMLEANPSWVAKLASVIRQGGMKILMELEQNDQDQTAGLDFGAKWKGRNVKTLMAMPQQVMENMIMATLKEDTVWPTDKTQLWWQAAFRYQMHCTDDTPLPYDKMNRYVMVMEEYARMRVAAIGNRLEGLKKKFETLTLQDFEIYHIHDPATNVEFGDKKDDPCVLKNLLTNEEYELPALKKHQGAWTLQNANDPDTLITAKDCPLQFRAVDYFPRMPKASEKWGYLVDAAQVAKAQLAGE